MKPRLIPEWRRAGRLFSMQAMALANALLGAWLALPTELQTHLPPSLAIGAAIALLVLGMVGRLVDQPKLRKPTAEAPTP